VAIYVDRAIWERWDRRWCHLIADDDEADELHAFAAAIGCKRERYQCKPRRPWVDHYDVDEERRAKAVAAGAIELSRREICEIVARKRAGTLAEREATAAPAGRPPAAADQRAGSTSTASPTATRPPSSTSP
jgi:hypothetical protein